MRFPPSFALAIVSVLVVSFAFPGPVLADPRDGDEDPIDHDFITAAPLGERDVTAVPASSTGTGQPPRVGANGRVNAAQVGATGGLLGRSETAIAATDDGQLIVAGWNDAQGFCGPPFGVPCTPPATPGLSGYGFSTDGGVTWTDGGAPPLFGNVFTRGDPWLARGGGEGATYFYANLAINATSGAGLGVSVHRGHFSGATFTWDDVRTFNAPSANDFYDKEAVVARPGTGDAYVSLTNFIEVCGLPAFGFGQIEVWRTHDGGDTWQGPVIVSPDITFITDPATPDCGFTGVLQQSSVPAVGPGGELYVVWQKGPTFNPSGSTNLDITFSRSLDGGITFSTPGSVASVNAIRFDPPVGYNRGTIIDHPRVTVATSGPNRGRVYVTYASAVSPTTAGGVIPCPSGITNSTCRAQRLTSTQVFLKFSDDQGATWSAPVPLGPAVPATGLKRFWPSASVEPGGNVDVVYYESKDVSVSGGALCNIRTGTTRTGLAIRRVGSAHSLVNTKWVRSTDGGATFDAPMTLSTATSDWCTAVSNIRPNFGDYISSASAGNRVLATWADGRNGVPDTFFAAGLGRGKSE